MRIVLTLLSLPLLLSSAVAAAVDAPPDAALMGFLENPQHRQTASAVAVEAFKRFQDCGEGTAQATGKAVAISEFGPIAADAGVLKSGAVKEVFKVAGCGKQAIENVLTAVDKGEVKSVPLIPGTTKADPLLARDSSPYVRMEIAPKIGNCTDLHIVDTRFDMFEGGPNPKAKFQADGGRPWQETWTLKACGNLVEAVVHYIPDETGTTISAPVTPAPKPH